MSEKKDAVSTSIGQFKGFDLTFGMRLASDRVEAGTFASERLTDGLRMQLSEKRIRTVELGQFDETGLLTKHGIRVSDSLSECGDFVSGDLLFGEAVDYSRRPPRSLTCKWHNGTPNGAGEMRCGALCVRGVFYGRQGSSQSGQDRIDDAQLERIQRAVGSERAGAQNASELLMSQELPVVKI